MNDINDDVMEELSVENDYHIRGKGDPTPNNYSSTSNSVVKKTHAETTSTSKETSTQKSPDKAKTNEKDPTANKSTTSMDLTQKIVGDLMLDYDVVEDLKKMKANTTVFKLCKITQLREQLHETLQHIEGPKDVSVGNMKETPKEKNVKENKMTKTLSVTNTWLDDKDKKTNERKRGDPRADGSLTRNNSKSQAPPFHLTFEIFNRNVYNYLVNSRASSNVIP